MAKHHEVNESEIKAAIKAALSAIRDQERLDISRSQRARLLSLRHKLGERLQPVFAEAGLDIEKINKIMAEHRREELSVLEQEKSKTAKAFAAQNEDLRRGVENRRNALEQLAFKPAIITPIPIWTAYEIDRLPLNIPFASHIEPSNNWAQISFEMGINNSGQVDVYFAFAWQNPTEYLAVMSADSDLVLRGTGEGVANPTELHGGHGNLDLWAQLSLATLSGGYPLYGGMVPIKPSVHADSPPKLFGGGTDAIPADFSGMYHLPFDSYVLVDAFDWVLFSVHFWALYDVDHGQVILDFSSSDNFIMCPSVQVDLLTPPPVIAP